METKTMGDTTQNPELFTHMRMRRGWHGEPRTLENFTDRFRARGAAR